MSKNRPAPAIRHAGFIAAVALGLAFVGQSVSARPPSPGKAKVHALTISLKTTGHNIVFDQTAVDAPFGQRLRLTYKNAAPKGSMINHDVAIIRPGRDEAVLKILQQNDYKLESLKGSEDVIGLTKTLQPGKSDTIEFLPPTPGEYVFICLMPGHGDIMGMRGTLNVK